MLGTLRLPLLVAITGSPLAAAVEIDWAILAGLIGALPGGWLGAGATGRFGENVLRVALGVVLGPVGIVLAVQAVR